MPKLSNMDSEPKSQPKILKGWKQIAEFLGEADFCSQALGIGRNASLGAGPLRHQFA